MDLRSSELVGNQSVLRTIWKKSSTRRNVEDRNAALARTRRFDRRGASGHDPRRARRYGGAGRAVRSARCTASGVSIEGSDARLERTIDAYVSVVGRHSITYRVLGDRAELDGRLAGITALAGRFDLHVDYLGDVMNGDTIVRVHDGDAPMRPTLQAWGRPPAALAQMRAIKARFDPHHTLNPGLSVGRI